MSVLPVGFGASGVDTGDITKSLRFRASGSTYMSRTFGTPTNANVWTLSMWVKRSKLTAWQALLSCSNSILYLSNTDTLYFYYSGLLAQSTAVLRDPSSHLHVCVVSNGTTVKGYINNAEVVSYTGTWANMNTAADHNIGRYGLGTTDYLDGYLSRICFVDGQALTPSSFGYLNTEINEWVTNSASAVKAVVDAGGTNSFMLDFEDGTSLTTLGNDYSTKNNDWTLTNHSLTAGGTYDWMEDRPGNSYPTLSPLDYGAGTLAEANLNYAVSAALRTARATQALPASGKWYWEVLVTAVGASTQLGIAGPISSLTNYLGSGSDGYSYAANALKYNNGSSSAYGASYTTNDVIAFAYDADAGTLTAYKNNATQGTMYSSLSGTLFPAVGYGSGSGSGSYHANFGQRPFTYTPPTGFLALCQANLPEGAVRNPKAHFDAKTRIGTAATYSVTGIEFQPDFVWVKSRGRAVDHALYDSVRGVEKRLETNNTDAEVTGDTTGLTAFNTAGYSGGALDQINGTTATNSFVDWLWKANGAAVSNTNGTITSQVSANQTAGFSVGYYDATGAAGTVGHGLGAVPRMLIIKNRFAANSWVVYHASVGNDKVLLLNSTNAQTTDAAAWNNTTPTSTVFSIGTGASADTNQTNASANDHLFMAFTDVPGYQKIGSYTGNGASDGPFVFCGFKPRWVMVKRTDATGNWIIYDTARRTFNTTETILIANQSVAEVAAAENIDILSNGFKAKYGGAGDTNTNTGIYVYLAIADTNGKYSNSR